MLCNCHSSTLQGSLWHRLFLLRSLCFSDVLWAAGNGLCCEFGVSKDQKEGALRRDGDTMRVKQMESRSPGALPHDIETEEHGVYGSASESTTRKTQMLHHSFILFSLVQLASTLAFIISWLTYPPSCFQETIYLRPQPPSVWSQSSGLGPSRCVYTFSF